MKRVFFIAVALTLIIPLISVSALSASSTYQAPFINPLPINPQIFVPSQKPTTSTESDAYYDDPYLSYQWALSETAADQAWEILSEDSSSVVVAVIDTGVD